jgi:hypothetical protein
MGSTNESRPAARPAGTGRIVLARVLVVLSIVLVVVSLLANFVKREALDTSVFRETAREMIADPAIRAQVAATAADTLYEYVDVQAELEAKLPENLQGLAGPIAGATSELVVRVADELLSRPRVQAVFVESATVAHRQLIRALEDEGTFVSTTGGNVVLDLRPIVLELGDRFGLGETLADRLPEEATQIKILQSDELETAQDATSLLEAIANWIWVLVLVLWVAAVWLAAGRRRLEVRAIAVGLVVAGLLAVVVRGLAGRYVVEELVQTDSVRPAAEAVWSILTDRLATAAWLLVLIGAVTLVGVWLTGPGRRANAVQRALAPYLRRGDIAYGAYVVLLLLFLWIFPWGQFRNVLIVIVLSLLGFESLRRVTAREHPDAVATDVWAGLKARFEGEPEPLPAAGAASTASELERLGRLHASGTLTDEEFAAAKARLLG